MAKYRVLYDRMTEVSAEADGLQSAVRMFQGLESNPTTRNVRIVVEEERTLTIEEIANASKGLPRKRSGAQKATESKEGKGSGNDQSNAKDEA